MLATLRKRFDRDDEEGFTLIELMVVVLIIAILLAIAIPTFLGARERAQNRAAQSDLRNALAAEKVFYTDNETYTGASADIDAIEPALDYTGSSLAAAKGFVSLSTGPVTSVTPNLPNNVVCLTTQSASGDVFALADIAAGAAAGTYYFEAVMPDCTEGTADGGADKW